FVDVNGFKTDHRAASALQDCFSNFDDAVDKIRGSLRQMRQLGAAGVGGVRTCGCYLSQKSKR
ncbi:21 kDa protein, partial [Fagus crenata]